MGGTPEQTSAGTVSFRGLRVLLETLFIERMDQNEEIFARYMNDPAFQALVAQWLSSDVYRRLGGTPAMGPKYPKGKRSFPKPSNPRKVST